MADENNAPIPGSPEYDAAMATKFDGQQSTENNSGGTPGGDPAASTDEQLILGKFKTQEDLEKAYQELETKLGTKEENPLVDATEAQKAAEEQVTNAGLDYKVMSQEFATNGKLSDETYASLEKAGITKDVVDSYIAGQQALADNARSSALSLVGGEEGYKSISEWAAVNLSEADLDVYNAAVSSNNVSQVNLAVLGLKAKFDAANGSEPDLLGGRNGEVVDGYESWAQVTEAMRDPRYSKDPAYRSKVEAKLGRSKLR